MIWITGDTHGDFRRFNMENFPEQKAMTKEDCVIICGDFGGVWNWKGEDKNEKYWLDWLESKTFTTVFVDGNHENHIRLAEYPERSWNNGRVHEIRPSVLHLMRGEVYEIEKLKFFAFGGASSHDISDGILDPIKDVEKIKEWNNDYFKMFRVNGRSWWKEELPSQEEMKNGLNNLAKYNNKIDFIITHSPHASGITLIGKGFYEQDVLTKYLEEIRVNTEYKRWFAGHMHMNTAINAQDILIYEQIIRIN